MRGGQPNHRSEADTGVIHPEYSRTFHLPPSTFYVPHSTALPASRLALLPRSLASSPAGRIEKNGLTTGSGQWPELHCTALHSNTLIQSNPQALPKPAQPAGQYPGADRRQAGMRRSGGVFGHDMEPPEPCPHAHRAEGPLNGWAGHDLGLTAEKRTCRAGTVNCGEKSKMALDSTPVTCSSDTTLSSGPIRAFLTDRCSMGMGAGWAQDGDGRRIGDRG